LTLDVETRFEIYWRGLTVGDPNVLDEAEMDRVRAKFEGMHYAPDEPWGPSISS
jgi:hypothetical protein